MPRVKVAIKYLPALGAHAAHDIVSGKPIPTYSNLRYGDTPASQAGVGEDAAEAAKTIGNTITPAVQAIACVGWVDVP